MPARWSAKSAAQQGGKGGSASDELLLAELATEAHCLPNGWVRETAQDAADSALNWTIGMAAGDMIVLSLSLFL